MPFLVILWCLVACIFKVACLTQNLALNSMCNCLPCNSFTQMNKGETSVFLKILNQSTTATRCSRQTFCAWEAACSSLTCIKCVYLQDPSSPASSSSEELQNASADLMDTLDELLDSLTAEASATQQQSDTVLAGNADHSEATIKPQDTSHTEGSPQDPVEPQVETIDNDAGQVGDHRTCRPCQYHSCMVFPSLHVPCENLVRVLPNQQTAVGVSPAVGLSPALLNESTGDKL